MSVKDGMGVFLNVVFWGVSTYSYRVEQLHGVLFIMESVAFSICI